MIKKVAPHALKQANRAQESRSFCQLQNGVAFTRVPAHLPAARPPLGKSTKGEGEQHVPPHTSPSPAGSTAAQCGAAQGGGGGDSILQEVSKRMAGSPSTA